jgi:hypothetical protein
VLAEDVEAGFALAVVAAPAVGLVDDDRVPQAAGRVRQQAVQFLALPALGGVLGAAVPLRQRAAEGLHVAGQVGPLDAEALALLLLPVGADADEGGEALRLAAAALRRHVLNPLPNPSGEEGAARPSPG